MIKQLIINNIEKLSPAMLEYGVILSETHPEVEFQPGRKSPVRSYLWYNLHLDIQPHTFVDYYQEKLAITDGADALLAISKWNDELYNGTLPIVTFDKIITTGDIIFGVMYTSDPSKSIVLMNVNLRYPYQLDICAGSGGYRWQYLDPRATPSNHELKIIFSLNKYQRNSFKNQW
jgi:hypothetical protein